MKLHFITTSPSGLKSKIINLIEKGELKTWEIYVSKNETYIKHTKQWGDKGVIRMTVDTQNSQLIAEVLKFEKTTESVKDFEGYYLGRFCEIIFVNFPSEFKSILKK